MDTLSMKQPTNRSVSAPSRSWLVALAAVVISLGAHAYGLGQVHPPAKPVQADLSDGATLQLGAQFATLAQAAVQPEQATAVMPEAPQPETAPAAPLPMREQMTPMAAAVPLVAVATQASQELIKAEPDPVKKPKAQKAKPKPKKKAKPKPQKSKAAAKASTARAKGAAGKKAGTKAKQGRSGKSGGKQKSAATSAAVKKFRRAVQSKITRSSRRMKTRARGTAHVQFTITASGGLASVSLRRSSGNKSLDKAALTAVRRAAPFPKPPKGAGRSFNMPISR
jgi:protein TonB